MSVEEQISQLIGKYKGLNARRLKQFNEENTKKDFFMETNSDRRAFYMQSRRCIIRIRNLSR